MKHEQQRVLQLIYNFFHGSGGVWPSLRDLQRALRRRGGNDVEAIRIVQHIPARLLKPLRSPDGCQTPNGELVLTAEGVKRCAGSSEDIANLVIAVKWLARRAERSDLSDQQSGHRVPFTTHQLAEALSLSLESDGNAISRVVAILQAEGWI